MTTPNTDGDQLVVGEMSLETYSALRSQLPLPSTPNQEFCGSIELAPHLYAHAYVPTSDEWSGDFNAFSGLLFDPFTNLPFAGGIIPSSRIPEPFAWRISTRQGATTITSTAPLHFVPVTPCRVADTRDVNGSFGAPTLSGQSTRYFLIPNSSCGIPANAQAYALNLTVVPQGKLDYLTVFPAGQQQPFTSTLNAYDGRVKANATIVPAGMSGGIGVFATESTDLIIDINGYFVPDSDTTALAFFPVAPCRLVDTRGATGPLGAPSLSAGQERVVPVLSSTCGVPAEAQAYALNYTVVPQGILDYLTTWPSGQNRPFVSTLNARTGTITANAAIVPAGQNGSISVYATQQTDLILDINGYFAPPQEAGLSLYNLVPCRAFDSRLQPGGQPIIKSTVITLADSDCGVPATATSLVLNATAVPTDSLLYLSLWTDGSIAQPSTSVLNAPDGSITSNLALVPTDHGSVSAFASDSTHLIIDVSGYFAP